MNSTNTNGEIVWGCETSEHPIAKNTIGPKTAAQYILMRMMFQELRYNRNFLSQSEAFLEKRVNEVILKHGDVITYEMLDDMVVDIFNRGDASNVYDQYSSFEMDDLINTIDNEKYYVEELMKTVV